MKAKPSTRKSLTKKADDLWSLCIKLRDGMKSVRTGISGTTSTLNAHHIISRANKAVRWDLDNGLSFGAGEHRFWVHIKIYESAEWIRGYIGTRKHTALMERSTKVTKRTIPDLKDVVENLKLEKERLEKEYEDSQQD